jgi:hypothetical protein
MDNNADDANADASLAGVVASMEAPPADNNADAANADAFALALGAPLIIMLMHWRMPLMLHWNSTGIQ